MVVETFTIWELLGAMLIFAIGGYLLHWGQTKSKELEKRR